MGYNPEKYNRRSTRLEGYYYPSSGFYFVTICTHNRVCLFREVTNGTITLNEWGRIARHQWQNTESIRDNVKLDAFVIMPNHVHGIMQITDSDNNSGTNDVGAYCNTPLHNDTPLRNNTPQRNDNPTHQS